MRDRIIDVDSHLGPTLNRLIIHERIFCPYFTVNDVDSQARYFVVHEALIDHRKVVFIFMGSNPAIVLIST
jgi:hypothetical protein